MNRRHILKLLTSAGLVGVPAAATAQVKGPLSPEHLARVSDVLKQMQSVKPGMTRAPAVSLYNRRRTFYRITTHLRKQRMPLLQGICGVSASWTSGP
jgi:hypothetical protein